MHLTSEELEAASAYVLTIRTGALQVVEETGVPEALAGNRCILSAIDGLIAAAAMIAEMGGIVPTARDKRLFADETRKAMLKAMKGAREEIEALGPDPAND